MSRTLTRLRFVVCLAGIGCSADALITFATNPPSIQKTCNADNPCEEGSVCHRSIGGGTCAASCLEGGDVYCAGLASGLVCHPQVDGGTCALDCNCAPNCPAPAPEATGDVVCKALGASLACQADGRCLPVPQAATSEVRFFNASTETAAVGFALDADPALVAEVGAGALSAYSVVGAGARVIVVADTAGTSATVELVPGARHTVVLYERTITQRAIRALRDDLPEPPPPASAWLSFVQLSPGLPLLDLRVQLGSAAPALVFGGVDFNENEVLRPALAVPAGAASVLVGPSPARSVVMTATVPVVAGTRYQAVSWGGLGGFAAETTVFDRTGVVARLRAAGVRLANATADMPVLFFTVGDGAETTATTQTSMALVPANGYLPIGPGTQRLRVASSLTPSAPFYDQEVTFAAGDLSTLIASGAAAAENDPVLRPKAILASETPPIAPGAAQVAVRFGHFAVGQVTAAAELRAVDGVTTTTVVPAIGYGTLSSFGSVDVLANVGLTAQIVAGAALPSGALLLRAGSAYTALLVESGTTPALWLIGPRGTLSR